MSTDERQYAVLLKKCSFARNPKIPVTLTPSQSRTNASLVDISLAIKRGEMVGVIGGMASGKSTLMSGRVDMVVEFCFQGKETIFVIPENAVFQDCFAEVSFVTYEGNQLS